MKTIREQLEESEMKKMIRIIFFVSIIILFIVLYTEYKESINEKKNIKFNTELREKKICHLTQM